MNFSSMRLRLAWRGLRRESGGKTAALHNRWPYVLRYCIRMGWIGEGFGGCVGGGARGGEPVTNLL
jgi:hypothetical protein